MAFRIRDRGPAVTHVVGNSGHINRKHPTCVVAEFPHVTLYQFESKSQLLRPLRKVGLSRLEVNAFVERSNGLLQNQPDDSITAAMEPPFFAVHPNGQETFHVKSTS